MNTLDFETYIPLALRTAAPLPTARDRLEHALLGLITETGEFTTEIKRVAIYNKPLDDERRKHIAEEIGDTLWYVAIASDVLGITPLQFPLAPYNERTLRVAAFRTSAAVGRIADLLSDDAQALGDSMSAKIGSEIQGIVHSLGVLSGVIGIPLQQIADENIDKLRERFPDAFSAEAAEARADKGGLDARNS